MTAWMLLLSETIVGGIRITAGLLLVCLFLSVRKPDQRSLTAAFAGALVISAGISLFRLPDLYCGALETVWIVRCAVCFQKTDVRMSLFAGIYYEITVFFWQFLFGAGAGMLCRSEAFPDRETGSGQAIVCLFHGVLFFLVL